MSGGNSKALLRSEDRMRLMRVEKKLDLLLKHLNLEFVDDAPSGPLSREVLELVRCGEKLEAIKLHKSQTGVSLFQAKKEVESFID